MFAVTSDEASILKLTEVNAIMRRIDLACKLFAPILVSGLTSFTSRILSTTSDMKRSEKFVSLASDINQSGVRVALSVVGATALLSSLVEMRCAIAVYRKSSRLQLPKPPPTHQEHNSGFISRWKNSWNVWRSSPICLRMSSPSFSRAIVAKSSQHPSRLPFCTRAPCLSQGRS